MASPYTISNIVDIALSDSVQNVFANRIGVQLAGNAAVLIAINAETVDVTVGVNIGGEQALEAGSRVTVQATVGVMPIIPDDQLVVTFGKKGQEIIVSGRNADAAASREVRAIARVFEMDDFALIKTLEMTQAIGAGLSR